MYGGDEGVAVQIDEVGGDAGAGVFERRGLDVGFDAIGCAGAGFDALGIVAVEERAAVEIEAEAELAGVGAVGGEVAVDVVGEAGAFGLEPGNGWVFVVA